MVDVDISTNATAGRSIRPSDALVGFDPAQSDISLVPRTDTLNEVILTMLRNIPTNLTTAEKNAIIERLGLTASGEGGTELPPYLQSDEQVLHGRAGSLYWDPINEVPIAGTVGHVLTKTGENDDEYALIALLWRFSLL